MPYNYKKVFFRRPILTEMNLIFFRILFFTFITVIPIFILFGRHFAYLPSNFLTQAFKEYTFSRLMQIPRSAILKDNVEINEIYFGKSIEQPKEKPVYSEIIKELEIPKVVESAPIKNSPLRKFRESKKIYAANIKKFSVESDTQVHIAKPNFTDFGVPQGYRNFEETIMVGRESKEYIETCLERYFRVQPYFRGEIVVKFDVHPDGYVIPESIKIIYSDIEYEPTKECIVKSIRRWVTYPVVPREQGIYSVTQKYIF